MLEIFQRMYEPFENFTTRKFLFFDDWLSNKRNELNIAKDT